MTCELLAVHWDWLYCRLAAAPFSSPSPPLSCWLLVAAVTAVPPPAGLLAPVSGSSTGEALPCRLVAMYCFGCWLLAAWLLAVAVTLCTPLI